MKDYVCNKDCNNCKYHIKTTPHWPYPCMLNLPDVDIIDLDIKKE